MERTLEALSIEATRGDAISFLVEGPLESVEFLT